ncbi:hypothetical protein Pelo_3593 [Pelomyxa schiedti]|nr:hypothetical protein Pelo_3593 [Pelomyxa schiedti]
MHQQRLTTHDELVISLSGALTAANQFVALASSFLPPRGGARGPRRRGCHVAAVPPHILVECVGKRWVVAVDRPVLAYLGARSRADFAVFFSVSHTLGLVQLPCFVDPNEHAYGWTAPDTCVVPQDTGSGSATDPNIMSLVVKKLQRAGEGEGEDDYAGDSECVQQSIARFDRKALRAACSRRWIVVSPKDSKRIMVWRVGGDGMARGDPVACPFTGELQKLRFWSTTSEYESESDTLEMSFLLEGPALCVHHVDLNKVWQEGEIRNPAVVFECSLTDELSEELCAPLIDRANLKYYLPFTKVGHKRKKAHRMVSTGKAVEYHSFKAATITSYNQVLLDLSRPIEGVVPSSMPGSTVHIQAPTRHPGGHCRLRPSRNEHNCARHTSDPLQIERDTLRLAHVIDQEVWASIQHGPVTAHAHVH